MEHTLIDYLELAAYKMREMLNFGHFDERMQENFERALERIEKKIADHKAESTN